MAVLHQAKVMSRSSKDVLQEEKEYSDSSQKRNDAMDIQKDAGSKQDCDWLKLSNVILRHPIVCGLRYDPFTERVREMLAVLKEFIPQVELERELSVLVTAAEQELRTLLVPSVPSENEEHSGVITGLLVGLKGHIPPGRCLRILREVLSFMKEEVVNGNGKRARSCGFESRGLLSLVGEYMHSVSSTNAPESISNHSKVTFSKGTSAVANNVPYEDTTGSNCLNIADVQNVLTIAVEEKSWTLFNSIGRLLKEHLQLVPSESDVKGALSVCLVASKQQHKEVKRYIHMPSFNLQSANLKALQVESFL